jgi:hypothetical protein
MEKVGDWLQYVAMFAPLATCVVGVVRFRKLTIGQRLLLLFAIFCLVNQSIAELFTFWNTSNLPFFHLHIAVELLFLTWIFFVEGGIFHHKTIQIFGSTLIFIAAASNAIWGEGLWNLPSILLVAESVLLILFVGIYFLKLFKEMTIVAVEREFLFWVSLAILLFFSGTLILSAFIEFLTYRKDVYFDVFLIRAVLIILTNICYAIGMLCKAHPQKS